MQKRLLHQLLLLLALIFGLGATACPVAEPQANGVLVTHSWHLLQCVSFKQVGLVEVIHEDNYYFQETGDHLKINLIGHSWGGSTAMDVTKALKSENIRISNLVTLDPVQLFPHLNPENFDHWVNVYQKQSGLDVISSIPIAGNLFSVVAGVFTLPFSDDPGDYVATLGGQLGEENGAINYSSSAGHSNAKAFFYEFIQHGGFQ